MCARDPAACLARLIFLAAVVVSAACDSPGIPESRVPAALQMVSGDTQTAVAGEALTDSLEVRVLNRRGEPVPGVEVEFSPATGGGTLHPARARTDANGTARAAWTLGPAAGPQTAQGRVRGGRLDALVFTARATPGAPARLVEVSGNHQAGTVGEPLPQPLVVRVVDALGNGIAAVPVGWHARWGRVDSESAKTDEQGYSRGVWHLGGRKEIGWDKAFATFQTDSVWFDVVALPGPVARLVLGGDSVQLDPWPSRMEAFAFDEFGNRIHGLAGFTWTNSDPGVALLEPDPVPALATVYTRAVGTTRISVQLDGLSASTPLRVVRLEGPFTPVKTGLRVARGPNDRGELVELNRDTLITWRNGTTVRAHVPGLNFNWGGIGYHPEALGISNQGVVLIWVRYSGPHPHADYSMLLKDGVLTTLGGMVATDINDDNWAVGAWQIARGHPYSAMLWKEGKMVPLSGIIAPGGNTTASSINDQGQVVVNAWRICQSWEGACTHQPLRGYLWEDGQFRPIPRPRPECSEWLGGDINNSGQVVVHCITGTRAAFLWDGTVFTDLSPITSAGTLNDRGEVVGWAADTLYLWRNGQALRLMSNPGAGVGARINNLGQILLTLSGAAYFLTPLP